MEQNGYGYGDVVARIGRLEAKIDQVLSILFTITGEGGGAGSARNARKPQPQPQQKREGKGLETLTMRQHAVLQMLLGGKTNMEIAERLGISDNTAKVHMRLLGKKAGVMKRSQIVSRFGRAFEDMDEADYRVISGGLPKNWDQDWGKGTEQFDALFRGE